MKINKIKKYQNQIWQTTLLKKHRNSSITGKMSKEILNFQIEDAIKNLEDDDIMKNLIGVFPANHMNKFIDFKSLISEKNGKYYFLIANTDNADKDGNHW